MRCALYFGSFNPLHIGHAAIARYVLENCNVDSLRLVLTPVSPFKAGNSSLTDANERLAALQKSVEKFNKELVASISDTGKNEDCRVKKLEISTVEFDLPQPNYTYNTLQHLKQLEPNNTFIIIMGADNLAVIERWYKGMEILKEHEIWVYPRKGFDTEALCKKYGATFLDAPLYDVSSTMIRKGLAKDLDMSHLAY